MHTVPGPVGTMFRLRNWPFTVKVALPFMLAVAIGVSAQVLAFGTIRLVQGNLEDVVNRKYAASNELGAIIERLRAAAGDLYLMQIKAAAGLPNDISRTAEGISANLAKVTTRLTAFKTDYATSDMRPKIDKALKQVKNFADATAFVGSMLDVDFKATANFVVPLKGSYDQMIADLEEINGSLIAESRLGMRAASEASALRRNEQIAFGLAGLATIACITAAIILATARSIRLLAQTTQSLADGDTEIDILALERRDELGQIVHALSIFRENILRVASLKREQEVLAESARMERRVALEKLATDFEASVGGIVSAVTSAAGAMEIAAGKLSQNAADGSAKSAGVSGAAQEARGYVQAVAGASEHLSVSIGEITRRVEISTSISNDAVSQARNTSEAVAELVGAAGKIGAIVNLIQGIAKKTNLLALNATIEAARAGEAGRGFAVVADEVKSLATQTARATDEIGQQIASIQRVTGSTAESINEIVGTIARIQEIAEGIAQSVAQQSAATREIAGSAQHVATSTETVADSIAAVSAAAYETGEGSTQVLDAATHLARQSALLRQEVEHFIRGVRAA